MSEAPNTETQAAVVAETPVADAAPVAQTGAASDIETVAAKGGWVPKDEWTGDPDKWVDAPQFVLKAAEILPQLTADLKEARAEIKSVKKAVADSAKFISAAEKKAYDRGVLEATARLEAAASIGDVEGVRNATQEIVDLSREAVAAKPAEAEANPDFAEWVAANPWWGKDKPLTAATEAIGQEVAAEGYTGKAQIKEVDKRIREAFPNKFTNPNRSTAAAVEGLGSARRATGKTYSDLPPEAREMVTFFEKNTKGFSRDKYIKDYFQETAK